jgi:hypothetical protein
MSEETLAGLIIGGLLVSCILAMIASDGRASALWGLLGPLGVIIAGFRGLHARLASGGIEPAREERPAQDSSGRVEIECASCSGRLRAFKITGRSMKCPGCSVTIDGYWPGITSVDAPAQ